MTAIVTRGDAGNLHLPDETVDLIVTSPPYFGLRSYQDGGEHYAEQIGAEATPAEYLDALMACTAEWMRVLKPGGSIFVNLGDKYMATSFAPQKRGKDASGVERPTISRACERCGEVFMGGPGRRFCSSSCGGSDNSPRVDRGGPPNGSLLLLPQRYAVRVADELGIAIRAEIVWAKPNAVPESARIRRVRRTHETWLHLVLPPRASWRGLSYYSDVGQLASGSGYSVPGSVWTVPTRPLSVPARLRMTHTAAFPTEWPRRLITGWCPPGGVVLDPFGGTGTTSLVASVLGRVGISVDLSADYCRLAQWRTADPVERARVLKAETTTPVQMDGQLMFDEGISA